MYSAWGQLLNPAHGKAEENRKFVWIDQLDINFIVKNLV